MSADCLFCKIASGTIPVKRLAEDEHALCFPDIHPQAPVHLLVIPKVHIPSLADTAEAEWPILGRLLAMASKVARTYEIDKSGYRTVMNTGLDAGQTVQHLHVHLLGGRPLLWPPG